MSLVSYFSTLNPLQLLRQLPGGVAQGLIWGIMAIGVYITFRLLDIADLTVDGSFATGGVVTVMLILNGVPVPAAIAAAFVAGLLAGLITSILNTVLDIPAILAGILTQLALYSINLHIMGMKANVAVSVDKYNLILSSRYMNKAIVVGLCFFAVVVAVLYWFFGTELGSALRATGANRAMSKAQGINTKLIVVLGLCLENGLVALSGGLFAQYQGFADVKMGQGAIVIGLAAVIIGEVFFVSIFKKKQNFAVRLAFVFVGAVLYYLVVVLVLWLRLNSNDLKLFTAVIVAVFLAVPNLKAKHGNSFRLAKKQAGASAKGDKDNA